MTDLVIDRIYPDDIDFKFIQSFDCSEFGFVLKTLTQAMHKHYPNNNIPNNIFFPKQTNLLKLAIYNGAKVLMASLKDDPDHLFGYIIADDRIQDHLIIHWIHVKSTWRKMGVAKQLLNYFDYQNKKIIITNYTSDLKEIKNKVDFQFNPYLWTSI